MRSDARRRARHAGRTALVVAAALAAHPAYAQETDEDAIRRQLLESQERLERIRGERRRLQNELQGLTSQVHDVSEEIRNLERQISTSSSLLAELDFQLGALLEQVAITTRDMLLTRDRLTARRVVLQQRLREIYKRGPLAPVQVLLSARSFGDLLDRYKYLHQVALFDRLLVQEVGQLENELEEQRSQLAQETEGIRDLRNVKASELDELGRLERQRQQRLRNYTARQSQAESRLAQLAGEEERLRGLIARLEEARRETERAAGTASVSTLRTADLGQLDWPVEGTILYEFGPQREGATTTLREGIGIGAPAGTPVRAIEAGQVMYAGARNLYGQTIIVGHGGGYYSVYLYLQSLAVLEGQEIAKGQVIGRVGGTATPEGPHIEFQIHEPTGAAGPRAVDPVRWLRNRP
ncbi:MAG: murein hydrolase activator EnvC family protein [Gemmatimonadota bacterium]